MHYKILIIINIIINTIINTIINIIIKINILEIGALLKSRALYIISISFRESLL